jgi:hypothetical protein
MSTRARLQVVELPFPTPPHHFFRTESDRDRQREDNAPEENVETTSALQDG